MTIVGRLLSAAYTLAGISVVCGAGTLIGAVNGKYPRR